VSLQYGIKEVMDLQIYDISTATPTPLVFIDYAQTTEIDNAGQRLEITGGRGNMRLLAFDHSKTSSMKLNLPLVDLNLLATLAGTSLVTGAQNVYQREVVTVGSDGTATLKQTPVSGTTPAVYQLKGARDNGDPINVVTNPPSANECSISGKTITFGSGIAPGTQVVVWYQYATPSTSMKFTMAANIFSKPLMIVGDALARNQVTGVDEAAKVTIYNARFQSNFNMQMSATNATALDLTLDMFAVKQGTDYVYYDVVFDVE
jgi:hypothetical protein